MSVFIKYKIPIAILFAAIFLEAVVFNFRYFESFGYDEKILENAIHSEG